MNNVKIREWLEKRPFLDELAGVHIAVNNILAVFKAESDIDWEAAEKAVSNGDALLSGGFVPLDNMGRMIYALTGLKDDEELPKAFRTHCTELAETFGNEEVLHRFTEAFIYAEELPVPVEQMAVAVTFAQAALSHIIAPHREELTGWLDVHNWQNGYCPTCGGEAITAHLKKTSKGRRRYLSCGTCSTRWRYKRMGCPYCDNSEQSELGLLEAENEPEMRIDLCNKCNIYLKTYTKDGMEDVALNDWASVHLDAACPPEYRKHGGFVVG